MPSAEPPSDAAQNAPVAKDTASAAQNANPTTTSAKPDAGEEKLSNAELKKRAKAEKQAKRANKKAELGIVVDSSLPAPSHVGPTPPPQQQQQPQQQKQQRQEQQQQQRPKQKQGQPIQTQNQSSPRQPQTPSKSQAKALPHRPGHTADKSIPEIAPKQNKNVALFGHLYTHPRRTTIAGASKDVHPAVLALGLQMSNYVICGSSARCVATLLAFKRIIESYVTPPGTSLPRNLTALLSPQIDYLVSCRPLSTSTGNAIRWLKLLINDVDIETPEEKAKADLCEAIDSFIRERITIAEQVIATTASSKIKTGDTILTFAKSNVVAKTLLQAHKSGKTFKVIIIDSRPLFEGKNLARTLATAGLDVQYSLTHATSHLMKPVTKVLLGAHAMLSNGRLYSRIGTAIVAMTAHSQAVPVIVCCESIKFTDRVALDSIVTNEVLPPDELLLPSPHGAALQPQQPLADWESLPNLQLLDLMYDVTPAHYIDMVITEHGSLPPSSVMSIHRLSGNS